MNMSSSNSTSTTYFGLSFYFGHGRTLGKRVMGIRAVSLTHEHLSLWHSMERALGYGASMLEGGFGFLQYFIHPNCQTVHDRTRRPSWFAIADTGRSPQGLCRSTTSWPKQPERGH